jgi:hypothetical protein
LKLFPPDELRPEPEPLLRLDPVPDPWLPPELELRALPEPTERLRLEPELELCDE